MTDKQTMTAFKLFAELNRAGTVKKDHAAAYDRDEEVRGLLAAFADEVDCTIIRTSDAIHMVPLTKSSIYHLTNDEIKRRYFPARALNIDVYLMYVAIILLVGEFYNSCQSDKPTRDFITSVEWLNIVNEKLASMRNLSEETLKDMEDEHTYKWTEILYNWEAMDNIKEGIKRPTIRTASRMSFIQICKRFMIGEGLVKEIGEDEMALTEKSDAIVTGFFMDYEKNRGILDFLYQTEMEAVD